MNNRIIPISLAISDKEQRKQLEQMIARNPMVRLVDDDAEEMGVLIYEPGGSVDEDMPHIIQALETGQAEDVYLAGNNADPEVLIRAMRSGIREFIKYPVDENDFRAAVMRTAMRSSLGQDEGEKGKIIAVLGSKSGMGATSLAVNLASVLNERKPGSTILVDMRRPYGETPYFLDLKFEYTWGELVEDISRLDGTYLRSVVAEHESGLHVLPGPSGFERPDPHSLFLILEQLRNNYEHVIVDTAYPHDEMLPKEVEQANTILIALQLSLPSLSRTSRLMDSIRSQDPDGERRMKLVANRVAKNSTIGVSEAMEVLGREIVWVIPEDSDSVQSAINQGTPLVLAYPKSPVTKVIRAMASALAPELQKARKGFSMPFASLFRKKGKNDDTLEGASL
ncbi:histidine kinase [uncultured Pseudodesulfovibrio sp.]|uniref:AAA family ATPase n=1 Tax=uncultured Pseudodesulfovibrio sp. TaxID=2035858 RepID=UPI0029C6A3F3|nr:histidine kinase [uncultured Pseudodesulfovibrio sp.]